MADSWLRSVYDRLPPLVQNCAVSAKGYQLARRRFGGDFQARLRAAERRDRADSMAEYRRRRLSSFLQTAVDAPFWDHRFRVHGVDPTADDPFSELEKLPVLTKQEVKDADRSLTPAQFRDGDLLTSQTSGTTGSGLSLVQTREALREQWAIWWRYRRRLGLERSDWCGYFGGRPVVPVETETPPYWRVNYPGRQVLFSTYHLRPETVGAYLNSIASRELSWLHGYPSALTTLADLATRSAVTVPDCVDIVTTGAETLFDHQRETIESVFDATVRQHYGLEEAVANVSECSRGTLHVDEDFAYVEFLPAETEGARRIVGTNWSNPAFPLLRYDTGDLAARTDQPCDCGVHGRTLRELLGRAEDYVVLPDGTRVGRLDHVFKDAAGVSEAQLYQPTRDRLIVRVVRRTEYDDGTEAGVRSKLRDRLGETIEIEFDYRESVPRTDSGKLKFVVSDVDVPGATLSHS